VAFSSGYYKTHHLNVRSDELLPGLKFYPTT
jgi:hypothetical protein